jgi:hypothetical protein
MASKGSETMARKPSAAAKSKAANTQEVTEQAEVAAPGLFVLKKNHGLIINGRASRHYSAGTTFDPATDGEVISHLVRTGAHLEEMVGETEPATDSTEQTGDKNPETDGESEGDPSDKQE